MAEFTDQTFEKLPVLILTFLHAYPADWDCRDGEAGVAPVNLAVNLYMCNDKKG